jgi:hypothetical protein
MSLQLMLSFANCYQISLAQTDYFNWCLLYCGSQNGSNKNKKSFALSIVSIDSNLDITQIIADDD